MDRYANQKTTEVPHRNGSNVRIVVRKPPPLQQRFLIYTASAADHFWTLADRFLDNTQDWWIIADMNPVVVCPDDLRWNTKLIIPVD